MVRVRYTPSLVDLPISEVNSGNRCGPRTPDAYLSCRSLSLIYVGKKTEISLIKLSKSSYVCLF
jgi:hypothetical protein